MTEPTSNTGQRIGRLTVTKTDKFGRIQQLRCDCGQTIKARFEHAHEKPPEDITGYHASYLLDAEQRRLTYDKSTYSIHAVPNNAMACYWGGLLLDGPGGMVLTELGAHMLAHWKSDNETAPEPAVAGAPPFTDERAAWIRDHVWTKKMRLTFYGDPKKGGGVPGLHTTCACDSGLTHWCQTGGHDRCHRATPQPVDHTSICGRDGQTVLHHTEPYAHPTPSVTGSHYETTAMVWLADRVCRWICPCDCHTRPEPQQPARPAKPVQLDLFGAAA